MKSHFVGGAEFKNFKCFKNISVDNIKRVNLIGGKNNIGKTSFMEGLELFLTSKNSFLLSLNLHRMMRRRQNSARRENYFELDFIYANNTKMEILLDGNKLEVEYFEEPSNVARNLFAEDNSPQLYEPSLMLNINNDKKLFSVDTVVNRRLIRRDTDDKFNINFVSSAATDEREIAIFYGKLVDLNKEAYLNDSLKLFDENIIALKQKMTERDVVLKIAVKNRETPILLSSLGDGINRYIAILCAIWASKDGHLFIDELENGIHYTNYDKLWRIIFEASKAANCQVFATTHSKECIEAFARVGNEEEGRYFEFFRNEKTSRIDVESRGKIQLEYALTHNSGVRGE